MTDIERSLEAIPAPPRSARRLLRGWPVFSGVLVLLLLGVLIAAAVRISGLKHALAIVAERQAEAMQQAEKLHNKALYWTVRHKGESIARSFRMINPLLLTDAGQRDVQTTFGLLMKDTHIAYVALLDQHGNVCATTDQRLTREPAAPMPAMTDVLYSPKRVDGADGEVIGPITDIADQQIGTVRVGLTFGNPTAAPKPTAPKAQSPKPALPGEA